MKLSVMLFPFQSGLESGKWTGAEVLEAFAGAGVTGVEPMAGNLQKTPELWKEFLALASDFGMQNTCYDIGANLIGESQEDREAAVETALAGIEYAAEVLDCPTVLLHGTRPSVGMTVEDGRRIYGEMLARIAREAGDCGVTVTIEDFGVYPLFTAAAGHCLDVLTVAGDPVRFTYDNGNFLLGGDRPMDVYDSLRPLAAHVHIKDFCVREPDGQPRLTAPDGTAYRGCLIGDGDAQVEECVTRLAEDDYQGWISLEVGGDALNEVIHGAKVVSETWERVRS